MSYIGYYLWGNSTPEDLIDPSPVPHNTRMIDELNGFKRSNLKRSRSNVVTSSPKALDPQSIVDELTVRVKRPQLKKVIHPKKINKKTAVEMLEEELKTIKLKLKTIDENNLNNNTNRVINNMEMITIPKYIFKMIIKEQIDPLIDIIKNTTNEKQKIFQKLEDKREHLQELLDDIDHFMLDFHNELSEEIDTDIQNNTNIIYALEEVCITSEPYLTRKKRKIP